MPRPKDGATWYFGEMAKGLRELRRRQSTEARSWSVSTGPSKAGRNGDQAGRHLPRVPKKGDVYSRSSRWNNAEDGRKILSPRKYAVRERRRARRVGSAGSSRSASAPATASVTRNFSLLEPGESSRGKLRARNRRLPRGRSGSGRAEQCHSSSSRAMCDNRCKNLPRSHSEECGACFFSGKNRILKQDQARSSAHRGLDRRWLGEKRKKARASTGSRRPSSARQRQGARGPPTG